MLTGGMESFIEVKEEDGGDHRQVADTEHEGIAGLGFYVDCVWGKKTNKDGQRAPDESKECGDPNADSATWDFKGFWAVNISVMEENRCQEQKDVDNHVKACAKCGQKPVECIDAGD